MNVAVVGLGPVGIVTATGLARAGHRVHATDRDAERVVALRKGRTPVVEPGLAARVAETVASGRLLATDTIADAVSHASVVMVCVGTPALPTGDADLAELQAACDAIGPALRRAAPAVVVVRSTVPPGTTRDLVARRLATASGLEPGRGFHVANKPEFLREGNALADYDAAPKLIVGALDPSAADAVVALFAPGPSCLVVRTTPEGAELAKYADNAWHATKVAFANELGALARALGVDGDALMAQFVRDRTLNISSAYLRPGAPFGGSCLTKDLAAIARRASAAGVDVPLIASLLASNHAHLARLVDDIATGAREVGIVGLAFKARTDDVRMSPYVAIAHALAARGLSIRAWDEHVARDHPACDPAWFARTPQALAEADTIVVCHGAPETLAAIASRVVSSHAVVDLTGAERIRFAHARYRSVAFRPERTGE